MKHTYKITGMTCESCEAKVKSALLMVENVISVEVSKEKNLATITMDKHIPLAKLKESLAPKYNIIAEEHKEKAEEVKSWLQTYKPILLIFAYIFGVTLLIQLKNKNIDSLEWMRHFMAGFFLVFSFFKMLNLKDFANTYQMYDIVAKKIPIWAYIYAFIELLLGVAYLIDFNPIITNSSALIIMLISIIGVVQSLLDKKKIQCACLGAVFNLPMSTITVIEDGLMIVMSAYMLFQLT
ncbi:heavy-metal-associated domain-containing protein [Riemerella columbina]|uniref:heavy-metal-associated domain-containing protein n=1 Tax=Riemerella columbina TaxID=103810 RepID=UPI000372DF32|nr:heavy metal-associated domain-containing protein [Riemerella columbina]WKS95665.1 cation transporter [Riemerella columbina]